MRRARLCWLFHLTDRLPSAYLRREAEAWCAEARVLARHGTPVETTLDEALGEITRPEVYPRTDGLGAERIEHELRRACGA